MKNYVWVFFGLFAISCSEKKDPEPAVEKPIDTIVYPELISEYLIDYMNYQVLYMPTDTPRVTLQYDSDYRITKRSGGLIPVAPTAGFSNLFSNGVFEEITYQASEIRIEKKDTLHDVNVNPDPKTIYLANNKIQKIVKETKWFSTTFDTTYFYYTNGLLDSTVKNSTFEKAIKHYTFNPARNLVSVTGTYINLIDNTLKYTTEETFGNFDNAANPTHNLGIFDETFNRSLSANNYRQYTLKEINPAGFVYATLNRTWNLKYDADGKVLFHVF